MVPRAVLGGCVCSLVLMAALPSGRVHSGTLGRAFRRVVSSLGHPLPSWVSPCRQPYSSRFCTSLVDCKVGLVTFQGPFGSDLGEVSDGFLWGRNESPSRTWRGEFFHSFFSCPGIFLKYTELLSVLQSRAAALKDLSGKLPGQGSPDSPGLL